MGARGEKVWRDGGGMRVGVEGGEFNEAANIRIKEKRNKDYKSLFE
jgi:hypothetical protein